MLNIHGNKYFKRSKTLLQAGGCNILAVTTYTGAVGLGPIGPNN